MMDAPHPRRNTAETTSVLDGAEEGVMQGSMLHQDSG